MPTLREVRHAADALRTTSCLTQHDRQLHAAVVAEYLYHDPENPDAEVRKEIEALLCELDDSAGTLNHYVFSCTGKGFGAAKIQRSDWVVANDSHSLPELRNELRKLVKPEPTIESEPSALQMVEAELATAKKRITELEAGSSLEKCYLAKYRDTSATSPWIYEVVSIGDGWRVRFSNGDRCFKSCVAGICDVFGTERGARMALHSHAVKQGWEPVPE